MYMCGDDYSKLYDIAFGKSITEDQVKEWREVLDEYNSFDNDAALGDIINGCTESEFDHFCRVQNLIVRSAAEGASYPLELPEYIEPERPSFDKEVTAIMDQFACTQDKADQFCDLLAEVQRVNPGLQSIEAALSYVIEHTDYYTGRRLNLITAYMYDYYIKYRENAESSMDEELAQKILDRYPPSLTKEYQCEDKVIWALQVALNCI